MENKYYVYVYLDPRKVGDYQYEDLSFSHEPFYLGKGHGRRDREHLTEHSMNRVNPFKNAKIKRILAVGLEPIILRLAENFSDEEALCMEIQLISLIGRANLKQGPLTNLTDGGESTTGLIYTDESKALMSSQRKGKKQTPAQYAANCARRCTDEHRRKISEAQKGITRLSEEQYRAIADKNRGQVRSDETRALWSAQRKGKKQTAAQYAANCARIDLFDWMDFTEFKAFVASLPSVHHKARELMLYIRTEKVERVPSNPYTVYRARGVWTSWNDVFGRSGGD